MTHKKVSMLVQKAYSFNFIGEVNLFNELFIPKAFDIVCRPYLDLASLTWSNY